MFFRRFFEEGLAQASYLVGCDATGAAMVVDANRDVAQYLVAAEAEKLRITHVTETHIHADFVSGSRELARRAGAQLLLSAEGGRDWQYAFAKGDHATMLHDRDSFALGRVRVDVMHTPGHTPEHLAFLVTDLASSDCPVGLFSGDSIFVGDVGRPDLLEKAAKIAGTMETAAHTLFHTLHRFRKLPDFVQLWPGHGAGSACGKALGAMPQSTVGYEKVANWGLTTLDEDAFVREVLAGQPDPPRYFAEMKRINQDGPPMLGKMPEPARSDAALLTPELLAGAIVIDARAAARFAESHIPGTLNIPLNKSFPTWVGWLVAYDRDVHLVVTSAVEAARAAREMAIIGLDRVAGWFAPDALEGWAHTGRPLECVAQMSTAELAARISTDDVTLVDVRSDSEWNHGHLPGALHIPLGSLGLRIAELPRQRPIVVQCQSGDRSAIAASVLLGAGWHDVFNLRGGLSEWMREGRAVL
jgi:hydroxyacylglutathione hydrolase